MEKYAFRSADIWTANKICGDSYQCKYDYSVSLNEDLAKNTLNFQDSFVNIKTRNKERGKFSSTRGLFFKVRVPYYAYYSYLRIPYFRVFFSLVAKTIRFYEYNDHATTNTRT